MLGNSGVLESSGDPAAAGGSAEGGSNSGEEEKDVMRMEDAGDQPAGGGGNRWPRPETLALLRIRSEMDTNFRDSTLKAPLWEEISRKMGELGYKRSAKKCKEKFENVYKYHKRTKDGRTGKSENKTYRFFDQLEALENLHSVPPEPKSQPTKFHTTTIAAAATATTTPLLPWTSTDNPPTDTNSSSLKHHVSVAPTTTSPTLFTKQQFTSPFVMNSKTFNTGYNPSSNNFTSNLSSLNLFSSSTSSSTASDEKQEGKRVRKRRRYWKGLFKRLTKELMEKQERIQKRFLETLEKREKERIAREEAWRIQETARINREHEILVHERSTAAAKDAAVISFLQKISGQQQQQQQQQQQKHKPSEQQQQTQHRSGHTISFLPNQKQERSILETTTKVGNGDSTYLVAPSPSRWPKGEVEALIRLRTNLDFNYQENATKGPLWEEISGGMRRLGYNRSAKRCKEKWENINKYFKKVKESNKRRPEDSKTCPYFHQLDAIYKERNKITTLPLMVAPEQQLLLPQENQNQISEKQNVGNEGDRVRDEEGDNEEDQEEEEEEEEEEEDTCEFEMVLNKTCSSMDINSNIIA